MNKFLSVLAVVLSLGLATASMDAEAAKRMGSGKSMGTQRQAVQDKAPAAPAAQNAAPAAGAGAAAKPSWMGPLAGLAAGLGIAALASHFGFGDELASMVMVGLLVFAVMAAVGFFLRKRAQAGQTGMQGPQGLVPATIGTGRSPAHGREATPHGAAYKVAMPSAASAVGSGSLIGSGIAASGAGLALPADFDRAGFERNAKENFIRLQAAYDAGRLDDIRGFTAPDLFAQLASDLAQRGQDTQHGEVLALNAQVLEVAEEGLGYVVSVQFTGFIRYGAGSDDETFDEIWHLTKPRQGNEGWVVAGIQQAS